MIEGLQSFAAGFPEWAQWIAIIVVSAVPFVESYFGSLIGVAIGLHPVVAILAAVVGNTVSMVVLVYGAGAIRSRVTKNATKQENAEKGATAKKQRLKRMFDKFGVPGVSLLGQTVLPSQITSSAMVSFGADRNTVVFWQIISIILWGVLFGVLTHFGISVALR